MYTLPLTLRNKVNEILDELEELDVIEKTDGPTPLVSPLVVIPKSFGDVQLCIDMRQANKATRYLQLMEY